ncbi:hypothetical protein D8674_040623 [Pyrus ussuriensis x Pyrus communis]|uniref:Uncharacterized protein n=1 Tax=Pyrus ussuriensis x Pyrus communis TaxID=2448454 RepID=A0A5N5H3I0_9ROSA|nr:hypothetical protein D8674_040623 [Pyrus ussuriensis x Pyrus communis]
MKKTVKTKENMFSQCSTRPRPKRLQDALTTKETKFGVAMSRAKERALGEIGTKKLQASGVGGKAKDVAWALREENEEQKRALDEFFQIHRKDAEQGGGEEDGAGETIFDQTGPAVDYLVADPANKTRLASST